jgi:hypothetical protein
MEDQNGKPMTYWGGEPGGKSPSSSSRCSVLDVYDNREVDSTWLASFCEQVSSGHFRKGFLQIECDDGQWVAYSYRPEGVHRLVEVNYRFEVANLLRALKIDA